MISSPMLSLNLEAGGANLPGMPGGLEQGSAEAFAQALLGALPAEAQGLTPEQLMSWLRTQLGNGLPAGGTHLPLGAELPLEFDDKDQPTADPLALLSALLSSRDLGLAAVVQHAGEAGEPSALTELAGLEAQANLDQLASLTEAGQQVEMVLEQLEPGAESLDFATVAAELSGPEGPQLKGPEQVNATAATAATQSKAAPTPEFLVRTPVQHPDFSQALGERLTWLVRQEVQQAKIHLDPPHLGPLEIAVAIKDDQASVTINAQNATTREVIEQDLQRLRGLLGESGFTSVDVNVAHDNQQQAEGQTSLTRGAAGSEEAEAEQGSAEVSAAGLGLVDQYA